MPIKPLKVPREIRDLRDYIAALEDYEWLIRIKRECHWRLEIPAITAMANRTHERLPLFENVTGYPGLSLFGDWFRGKYGRMWFCTAIGLGMDPYEISYEEWVAEYMRRLEHPIKPVEVKTGPCKEELFTGPDADVIKQVPVPYLHDGDGGRYITQMQQIARDPDSPWVNWACYRIMVHTGKKLTSLWCPGQQNPNLFYYKYEPRGIPMPLAIGIGGHPTYTWLSQTPLPAGWSEVDYCGGLMMKPVELVKAETIDMLVPANDEYVIECVVQPGERIDEGPFGEYLGYIHGPRRPMPLFRVSAVTRRVGGIHPFCMEGTGVGESINVCSTSFNVLLTPALMIAAKAVGLPVKFICGPETNAWSALITQLLDPSKVKEISQLALCVPGPSMYVDHNFVVDPDIDITELETVWEEILLKSDPVDDWHNFGDAMAPRSTLNIYMTAEEKAALVKPTARGKTCKTVINGMTKEWDEKVYGPKRLDSSTLFPTTKEWVDANRERFKLPPWKDYREGLREEFAKYLK